MPNPVTNYLFILIEDLNIKDNINPQKVFNNKTSIISIYNKFGMLALQEKIVLPKKGKQIDVSKLPKNEFYTIVVVDENGNKLSGKFMKF